MREPVVGVILLNWNGYDDTAETLASLLRATPRPAYVVVVDNGSHDHSVSQLSAWGATNNVSSETCDASLPYTFSPETWLRIILSSDNRGFAGGNNIGLAHLAHDTNTTHFLLLNNDALVAPDYFARLLEALTAEPDAGIMGCTIFHYPETNRVWFAGGYEDRLRGVALHRYEVPERPEPFATEWVTGCAMLISRTLYEAIGGLAECYYPIYCEDSDYSLQARTAGFGVVIAPRAHVYHKVGATVGTGEVVPRVAYWQTRHRVFSIRRNYSPAERVIAISYLCVAKPARATLLAVQGRGAMAAAILRGLVHGLRNDLT
ncbi:MAG: glycosyltransferase family 2 protein [Gemmatimonadaceae bacterium]